MCGCVCVCPSLSPSSHDQIFHSAFFHLFISMFYGCIRMVPLLFFIHHCRTFFQNPDERRRQKSLDQLWCGNLRSWMLCRGHLLGAPATFTQKVNWDEHTTSSSVQSVAEGWNPVTSEASTILSRGGQTFQMWPSRRRKRSRWQRSEVRGVRTGNRDSRRHLSGCGPSSAEALSVFVSFVWPWRTKLATWLQEVLHNLCGEY